MRKPMTDDTKRKISENRKGKGLGPRSEQTKEKISKAHLGVKLSDEHRRRISERVITDEWRKHMSEARMGQKRVFSEEHRRHLSEAQIGRVCSKSTRQKLAIAKRGQLHSEETKLKMSLARKGKKHGPLSEETKQKLRMANLGKKQSHETIAKKVAKITGHRGAQPSAETLKRLSEAASGPNNANWRGGLNRQTRARIDGQGWRGVRRKVLVRDKDTCQLCYDHGRSVHHKVPWRFTKDNTDNNLVTLCTSCHSKIDSMFRRVIEKYFLAMFREVS